MSPNAQSDRSDLSCCKRIEDVIRPLSPFNKWIALGYYDGFTDGLAQCANCGSCYSVKMIDSDDAKDVRIFRFSPLPTEAFDRLVAILSPLGPPNWPVWLPVWKFESETAESLANRTVADVLSLQQNVTIIAAFSPSGHIVLAAKRVSEMPDGIADWFRFLSVPRAK